MNTRDNTTIMKQPAGSGIRLRAVTPLDLITAAALVLCAIGFTSFMRLRRPETVVIYRDNKVIARYPLDENREITIDGNAGPIRVKIDNRQAAVIRSRCRNQICVRTGAIRRAGHPIICVPNHVAVEIQSNRRDSPVDAIAQ